MKTEKKKYNMTTVIALASILLVTSLLAIRLTLSSDPYYVGPAPAQFRTIQDAINNVPEGSVIEVMPQGGPYIENVVVNKSLTLRKWTSAPLDECIVNGNRTGPVFNVTANGARIYDFTIKNGTYGIYLNSENNAIANNTMTLNSPDFGIFIAAHSRNNTLTRNRMVGNARNFGVGIDYGLLPSAVEDLNQTIDTSNTVDGKPIYYWVNEHDRTVPSDAGYIAVVDSTNITVKSSSLSRNDQGILIAYTSNSVIENVNTTFSGGGIMFWYSHNNTIRNSIFSNNDSGIEMDNSTDNVVTDNIMSNNPVGIYMSYSTSNTFAYNTIAGSSTGIIMGDSNNNTFYLNNMLNGENHQRLRWQSVNAWDNGREGNYWNDYHGSDTDGNGIGDTAYNDVYNPSMPDYYPLIEPWSYDRTLNITSFLMSLNIWSGKSYAVTVSSNHVVASIKYHMYGGNITFNVVAGGSTSYNVSIPRDRLDQPFHLFINDTETTQFTVVYNATQSFLYFNYTEGRYSVTITAERKADMIGDLNGDGKVDMRDIGIVCNNYGKLPPQ